MRRCCYCALVLAVSLLPAARGQDHALDLYGDPLPPGAVARLGTVRFRFAAPSTELVFLSDNKTLLTYDLNALQFWDATTGTMLRELRESRGERSLDVFGLQRLALAPDGRQVALTVFTKSEGKPYTVSVRVLALTSGKVLQTFARPNGDIPAKLAFSPDSKLLLSLSSTGILRVEEIASGKEKTKKKPIGEHNGLSISPNGDVIAFRLGGNLYLWRWAEEGLGLGIREMPGADETSSVAFSPDGKRLAGVTERSGLLRVWDMASRKLVYQCKRPDKSGGFSRGLLFTPDGQKLLARYYDYSGCSRLEILNAATGRSTGRLDVSRLGDVAVSPDSRRLAAASGQAIRVWDLTTLNELANEQAHHGGVAPICMSQGIIATTADDDTVRLWDAATGKHRRVHQLRAWTRGIALSPDGKFLATSSFDDTVRLFAVDDGREIYRLPGHGTVGGLRTLEFARDGKSLLSFGDDLYLRQWDLRTGRALVEHAIRPSDLSTAVEDADFEIRMLLLHMGKAAFSPDGKVFVLDIADHLYLFDVASGKQTARIAEPVGGCDAMIFSPDGKHLLVQFRSPNLYLWNLSARDFTKIELPGRARAPAFSADSRSFAVAIDEPDEILIFETATTRERHRIRGFRGRVESLAFYPDGRRLASGLSDSTVLIWDLTAPRKE